MGTPRTGCAFPSCVNDLRKLQSWKKKYCDVHHFKIHRHCGCEPPFRLLKFPTLRRDQLKWAAIAGVSLDSLGRNPRVCCVHLDVIRSILDGHQEQKIRPAPLVPAPPESVPSKLPPRRSTKQTELGKRKAPPDYAGPTVSSKLDFWRE